MGGTSEGFLGNLLLQTIFFWLSIEVALLVSWLAARHFLTDRRHRLLRFLRLILIPYLALISGGVSPYWMGLSGINWQIAFSLGSILIACSLLLWIFVRSIVPIAEFSTTPLAQHTEVVAHSKHIFLFFEGGAGEFNRSFWRAGLTELFRSASMTMESPAYWGGVFSTLFLLPEILFDELSATQRLISVVILLFTSVLFFYTRNFWLCWMAHILLRLISIYDRTTPERD